MLTNRLRDGGWSHLYTIRPGSLQFWYAYVILFDHVLCELNFVRPGAY